MARADGSVGWCVSIANSIGLFAPYLDLDAARIVFGDMRATCAWGPPNDCRGIAVPGGYRISGQKIWTSRFLFSDLYLLLARTTPPEQTARKTEGLSLFLVDIAAAGEAIKATPIRTMLNHHTCQVFLDNVFVPEENLIGEEGKGFDYIVDSLNAERLLVASESVGDGKWFVETASRYASERVVFDRPIGANQGVQFPLARAPRPQYIQIYPAFAPNSVTRKPHMRANYVNPAAIDGLVIV